MRARAAGLALAACLACADAPAREIAHTSLPERLRLPHEGSELVLNGAGLRTRFRFEIYVIGLYLPEKKTDDDAVLAQPGAKRIRIVMLRDVTGKQMVDGLVKVMHKNNPEAAVAALKREIDEFEDMLLALGKVPKSTVFDIDFAPKSGTRFAVNGIPKGRPLPGEPFYRAVLRIWLGDKPEQPNLKQALLGG